MCGNRKNNETRASADVMTADAFNASADGVYFGRRFNPVRRLQSGIPGHREMATEADHAVQRVRSLAASAATGDFQSSSILPALSR
jgi:hypothetical protein